MRRYFVVSRWWDHVMGWALWLRRRPRCARSPFEPPPLPRDDVHGGQGTGGPPRG